MKTATGPKLSVYAICICAEHNRNLLQYVGALTFAATPDEAERRYLSLYPDARQAKRDGEKLHVLPAWHQTAKTLLEREGLTVTDATARFALLEAKLAVAGIKSRKRKKRRQTARVAVAGPEAGPLPVPVTAAPAPIPAPAAETLDRAVPPGLDKVIKKIVAAAARAVSATKSPVALSKLQLITEGLFAQGIAVTAEHVIDAYNLLGPDKSPVVLEAEAKVARGDAAEKTRRAKTAKHKAKSKGIHTTLQANG